MTNVALPFPIYFLCTILFSRHLLYPSRDRLQHCRNPEIAPLTTICQCELGLLCGRFHRRYLRLLCIRLGQDRGRFQGFESRCLLPQPHGGPELLHGWHRHRSDEHDEYNRHHVEVYHGSHHYYNVQNRHHHHYHHHWNSAWPNAARYPG